MDLELVYEDLFVTIRNILVNALIQGEDGWEEKWVTMVSNETIMCRGDLSFKDFEFFVNGMNQNLIDEDLKFLFDSFGPLFLVILFEFLLIC